MSPVPRSLVYTVVTVFSITSAVWIYGVTHHRFLASEIGIYIGIFLIPGAAVCTSIWLLLRKRPWNRIAGAILLIPGLGIWVLSLMLVSVGFRIH